MYCKQVAYTLLVLNAMNHAVLTTSYVVVRAVRVTLVFRFYLSLEDDLMRIFAGDRVVAMMRAMGLKEDEAIEHKMVSRSIENAQRKVEARNFDIRKTYLNMMM